uniref:Receptor (G protein-coupled) activity modifying protein 2 n=1 Tax=Gasterosteus aculeatus aculeatus TaxID=481459 RepID=A0AAQ4PJH8_GASAC
MTATSFPPMISGCFITLLIWAGCSTVVCLVNEKITAPPATPTGYFSTVTEVATCGNNSDTCGIYCRICDTHYHGPTMDCLSTLLQIQCITKFYDAMASLNSTEWCTWSNVGGLYSNLSLCTEEISDCLMIPWPNPLVEQTFVEIHSSHFKDCPSQELSDPPPVIVFALVMTPICLIPVMVSLVVLKTKNGDGRP